MYLNFKLHKPFYFGIILETASQTDNNQFTTITFKVQP